MSSFTYHKILRHGTSGVTSHPKEGVLRIFIALAGFEPATVGSSGKQTNHYTAKATGMIVTSVFTVANILSSTSFFKRLEPLLFLK
jgi:hypothetical protein